MRHRTSSIVLTALVACGGPRSQDLFQAGPVDQKLLATFQAEPGVIDIVPIEIDLGMLKASSFDLPLGKDRVHVKDAVTEAVSNGDSVVGAIGDDGLVVLVIANGEVTGTIVTGTETYQIWPMAGEHFLVRRGLAGTVPDHPPGFRPRPGQPPPAPSPPSPISNAVTSIKLVVFYTAAVLELRPNIVSWINVAVKEANTANDRSLVKIEFELAGPYEDGYKEDADIENDLWRLVDKDDDDLPDAHLKRDQDHADIAILVVNGGAQSYKGVSASIMATEDLAFAVVDYRYLNAPYFTFEHEIGHLMGLDHNLGEEWDKPWLPYGRGHKAEAWRTIMAILCTNPAEPGCTPREANWSNPLVDIDGDDTGVPGVSDSALALVPAAPIVAKFRTP
jgi:hypothetical protein